MRTTFDLSSSRTRYSRLSRTTLWSALLLILGSLLLIALDNRGFLRPVKSQAQVILRPVERVMTQTRLAVGDSIETVRGTSALQRRVAALEQEVSDLRQANLRLQGLQAENDRLKVELGVRQTYEWMTVGAVVVQANAENGRRMIRIDRGRVDGLQLGMPVVAKEGGSPAALIGIVDALYAQTSDVLLITDYGSSISAHTTQPTPAKGLVIGQWQVGDRIKLVDVDPGMPLAPGDYVVTSGLSKEFAIDTPMARVPADIPIGTVTRIDHTSHTQSATLQPFVDPDRVRDVWVITGQK
jgi:rod shape-determining protein MreC